MEDRKQKTHSTEQEHGERHPREQEPNRSGSQPRQADEERQRHQQQHGDNSDMERNPKHENERPRKVA